MVSRPAATAKQRLLGGLYLRRRIDRLRLSIAFSTRSRPTSTRAQHRSSYICLANAWPDQAGARSGQLRQIGGPPSSFIPSFAREHRAQRQRVAIMSSPPRSLPIAPRFRPCTGSKKCRGVSMSEHRRPAVVDHLAPSKAASASTFCGSRSPSPVAVMNHGSVAMRPNPASGATRQGTRPG